jgi:hypothetical protein
MMLYNVQRVKSNDARHAHSGTESDLAAFENPNVCLKLPDVLGHKVFDHTGR